MPEFELKQGHVVYLSGPMTGYPDHNKPLFDAAKALCESKGLVVISPADLDEAEGVKLEGTNGWEYSDEEVEGFLERDFDGVAKADAIVFLKGWSFSGGAGREGRHAIDLGKALYILDRDPHDGEWFPFLRITESYFLEHSRTERLRPHERAAKQSS